MARLPLPPSFLLIARTSTTAYFVIVVAQTIMVNSQLTCMHVIHCHFGDSSKLESRGIFKTHPPEEPLKITPQLRAQMAAFRPILRHGRGGVGPSGITCDCKLPSSRLYMSARSALGVYNTTQQSHTGPSVWLYLRRSPPLDRGNAGLAAGRTSTTGVFKRPSQLGYSGMGCVRG